MSNTHYPPKTPKPTEGASLVADLLVMGVASLIPGVWIGPMPGAMYFLGMLTMWSLWLWTRWPGSGAKE